MLIIEGPEAAAICSQHVVAESTEMELDLHSALMEAITLEPKYQAALTLQHSTKDSNEISLRMRNGSAHVLRCLKVWYDLPADTFFMAVNLMDRFLTRMRAQPKHLSCIAVSAFHLACQHTKDLGFEVPDRLDLTNISQAKCGAGDVKRMEKIMVEKLTVDIRCQKPITPLTFLRLLHACHGHLARPHLQHLKPDDELEAGSLESSELAEDKIGDDTVSPMPPSEVDNANKFRSTKKSAYNLAFPSLTNLIHKMEIIASDSVSTLFRAAELALALLTIELEQDKDNEAVHRAVMMYLYNVCKIITPLNIAQFQMCMTRVYELVQQYENQHHSPHRQRLVWKLSHRTLRQLRPMDKLKARMPTIDERQPPPHPIIRARLESCDRYSSCSEEEMDFDYDEEFPPLPTPSVNKSSLKSASASPRKKKKQKTFPYPKVGRKHGRTV